MHPTRPDELTLFKSHINLTEFAAGEGYTLDRQHSSRNSVTMRGPAGDKIIIARNAVTGDWIYFSIGNDQDNGTIIDFLDHRGRSSLGDIRKELRPWVGLAADPPKRPPAHAWQPEVQPIQRDLAAMLAQFAAMTPLTHGHPYLEDERGIPLAVLEHPRFAGRIYTDRYHNAVFPHHNRAGVCGYEIRNFHFKGFAKGGEKGVWYSTLHPDDTVLVIAESAIDALSYHALHSLAQARYFSIAGEMNPLQRDLLASGMHRLSQGSRVILATDHDAGGEKLARHIREIATTTGRADLAVIEHRPERAGDWNDALRASLASYPNIETPRSLPPHPPEGASAPDPA